MPPLEQGTPFVVDVATRFALVLFLDCEDHLPAYVTSIPDALEDDDYSVPTFLGAKMMILESY